MNHHTTLSSTNNPLPKHWPLICISNLLIAALIGLCMRYKIVFPFPALDQGNALHAHANFVFSGWVSLTLFSCIVSFVLSPTKSRKKMYKATFYFLEITSIGMLISFLIQGYGTISICLTLLSAAAGCLFIFHIWKDLKPAKTSAIVRLFLKGAMLWYLLSILGTIVLIYLSKSGAGSPIELRSSFYFFLHFQYNGWFTFCIFGLLLHWLFSIHRPEKSKKIKAVFWLLSIGLIPGYFLSILAFYPFIWVEIPSFISVFSYFVAAFLLFVVILKIYPQIKMRTPKMPSILWKIATLSFFLKTMMQAATLVPSLASFAFSFRPLIIGFLHLTFLCFVTFFLIGYLLYYKQLQIKNIWLSKFGLIIFIISVILSEAGLFVHSFFAFIGIYSAIFTLFTFWVTVGIFLGFLLFFAGQFFKIRTVSLRKNLK